MKEYIVTKKISNPQDATSVSDDNSDRLGDLTDDFESFCVVRLRDRDNKDLTSKIDTNFEFEDDEELTEYLAQVFNEDPDEIEIIEDESTIEFKSPREQRSSK
jgi:hypothetical protein